MNFLSQTLQIFPIFLDSSHLRGALGKGLSLYMQFLQSLLAQKELQY
jgi:hypothetical protein